MAYAPQALRRIGQTVVGDVNGKATSRMISLFQYATDDAAAVVEAAGYFNAARDAGRLTAGTTILASMAAGGTPLVKQYVCVLVPGTGNVTIAAGITP